MQNNKSIVKSATFLGVGTFIAKLLGALYRVPLTAILGGVGLGLYQMVFPVYALLLDFSGASLPSALSKLISSKEEGEKYKNAHALLNVSARFFALFGFVLSALLMIFARPLARLQGNEDAFYAYIFLAPAIFLVSLISVFRGYFQGLMNMKPTTLSQIVEQFVKLILGVLFAYLLRKTTPLAVAGATFAITLSEFVALIQLFITYKRHKKQFHLNFAFNRLEFKIRLKSVIKTTLPITLVGILIPLSQVVDSFIIINLLSVYRSDSTALYGLLSGVCMTVINLPVAVCYGIATTAIPAVSAQKTVQNQTALSAKAILMTIAVALPCTVITAVFSPLIIRILFGSLSESNSALSQSLLAFTSPCILLLSLVQTTNAILIGKGKLYRPLISLSLGVVIKTILNIILIKMPSLNIYGGGAGLIACYFVVCLINLLMIFKFKVNYENKHACGREYAS